MLCQRDSLVSTSTISLIFHSKQFSNSHWSKLTLKRKSSKKLNQFNCKLISMRTLGPHTTIILLTSTLWTTHHLLQSRSPKFQRRARWRSKHWEMRKLFRSMTSSQLKLWIALPMIKKIQKDAVLKMKIAAKTLSRLSHSAHGKERVITLKHSLLLTQLMRLCKKNKL